MKVCFSLKLPNPAEYPFFQWKGWTGCCVWRRKKRNSTPKSVNWWSPAPIFRWETAINLSPLESEFLIAVHGADQWKQLTCAGSFRNATQEFLHTKNNRWRRFLHCISCRHEKTTFSDLPCWIPKTCYSWFLSITLLSQTITDRRTLKRIKEIERRKTSRKLIRQVSSPELESLVFSWAVKYCRWSSPRSSIVVP